MSAFIFPWLISKVSKSSGLGSWFAGSFESFWNSLTGAGLTGADREANAWSEKQSQIARDWQESMYNQYESPSAMVSQYQQAGLNPALLYGQGFSSPASTSPMPSTVSGNVGSLDLIGAIAQLSMLGAEIDNKKADTDLKLSEAKGRNIENEFKPLVYEQNLRRGEIDIDSVLVGISEQRSRILDNVASYHLTMSTATKVVEETNKLVLEEQTEVLKQKNIEITNEHLAEQIISMQVNRLLTTYQIALTRAQTSKTNAETRLISAEAVEQEFGNVWQEQYGFRPGADQWQAATSLLGVAGNKIGTGIDNVIDKVVNSLKRK